MKIILVAPFEKPECTAFLILNALLRLGLDVRTFPYRSVAFSEGTEKMNQNLKGIINNLDWDDLLLVIKGENITQETIDSTHARKALWFWDFDSYEPPKYLIENGKVCDFVFLMCYPWVEKLRNRGINAFFLPQATDPFIYHPVTPESELQCDIAFIGTQKPNRREILHKIAERYDLRIYGEQWGEPIKPMYLNDFNRACSSAKIVFNITPSRHWPVYEKTFSQRVYMVLATQTLLLCDRVPGISEFFEVGKELVIYDDWYSLRDAIEYYTRNKDKAEIIAKNGRERILREHTYFHRIQRMFECLGLLPSLQKNTQA